MTARKRKPARPAWLTDEAEASIRASVEAGNTIATAVACAGVSFTEAKVWAAESPENDEAFRAWALELEVARAKAEAKVVDAVVRDAVGGTLTRRYTKTYPNGTEEVDETFAPPNGRSGLSWLQARNGAAWGKPDMASDMLGDFAPAVEGSGKQDDAVVGALAKRLRDHLAQARELEETVPEGAHTTVAGSVVADEPA